MLETPPGGAWSRVELRFTCSCEDVSVDIVVGFWAAPPRLSSRNERFTLHRNREKQAWASYLYSSQPSVCALAIMSLFDIAAGLSQFSGAGDDDRCVGHENAHGGSSLQPRSSTLCLLDETLQTLYDASHGSKRTAPAALFSSSTRVLGASKSSEELDQRLRDLTRTPPSSTRSPCHPAPSEKDALQRTASYSEADKAARTLLRQLSDEIDQLTDVLRSVGSDARVSSAARFLVEKYMDAQLVRFQKLHVRLIASGYPSACD